MLDEPTNNLGESYKLPFAVDSWCADLESVAALADCVKNFRGAVVVVSHDQYFVSQVAQECYIVGKGTVKRAASFEAYVDRQVAKLRR